MGRKTGRNHVILLAYLVEIPDPGLAVDVVLERLEHLLLALGQDDQGTASEVETGRAIIFRDTMQNGAWSLAVRQGLQWIRSVM